MCRCLLPQWVHKINWEWIYLVVLWKWIITYSFRLIMKEYFIWNCFASYEIYDMASNMRCIIVVKWDYRYLHASKKFCVTYIQWKMKEVFCMLQYALLQDWNRIYIVTMSSLRDYMIRISFLCNAHTLLKRKYKYKVIRSYLRLDFHSGKHENHFSRQNQKLV